MESRSSVKSRPRLLSLSRFLASSFQLLQKYIFPSLSGKWLAPITTIKLVARHVAPSIHAITQGLFIGANSPPSYFRCNRSFNQLSLVEETSRLVMALINGDWRIKSMFAGAGISGRAYKSRNDHAGAMKMIRWSRFRPQKG